MTWINRSTGLGTTSIYWIVQNPATRHLSNESHELWAAGEGGIFHTIDGGRNWATIPLPDPSNAEYQDGDPPTAENLRYIWIEYDPSDELIMYVFGAHIVSERLYMYKTTDLWQTAISRGIIVT